MNLPNLLSLSRIALLPFVILALRDGRQGWLLGLMLAAGLTDFFDGLLARKFNQITTAGKVIDPVADKVCVDVMVFFLWLWRDFPCWAATVIIGRDILILVGGLFIVANKRPVPVSNWPGKVAVTVLAGAIICYAMGWQPWGYYVLLAGAGMAVWSGILYLKAMLS